MPITKREAKEIVDWVVSELHRKGFLYLTDGKVDLSKVRVGTISGTASLGGRISDGAIWNRHVAEDADIRGTKVRIATTSERGTVELAEDLEIASSKAVQANDARLHSITVANATEHDARYYCFDSETELLTTSGWKHYQQLNKGEGVFSLNLLNSVIEQDQINGIYLYDYDGILQHFNSESVDILVTPDHRIVGSIHTKQKYYLNGGWKVLSAKDWCAKNTDIVLPVAGIYIGDCSLNDDLFELLGWFIGDGGIQSECIQLYQKEGIKSSRIQYLLDKLKIPYSIYRGKQVKNGSYLTFRINVENSKSLLPLFKKDLSGINILPSKEIFDRLLYGLIESDGSRNNDTSFRFYQKDRVVVDKVQYLCTLYGYGSRLHRGHPTVDNVLNIVNRSYTHLTPKNFSTEYYKGVVWCVNVNNGTVIIRRNGKVSIVGNTEAELNAGQLDTRYFTETELSSQWGADLIGISNPSGYWVGDSVQNALDELYKRKFKSLSDVPNDYAGYAGQVVAVRATEDGLEFVIPSGGGASTFLGLDDTPSSYAGQQGKAVVVNASEDGVEFILISGATTSGGGSDFNPDRMFSFVPEFPNAILFADGVTNSGTLILDYDEGHNFYDWTTLEAMAQDYDIYLKFLIPPDLNTMGSGIYIWNKSDPSVNTGVRLVEFLDSVGANLITDSLAQSSAWTESFWELSGGTWYVNTLATLHFKMQSDPYYHARIGEVRLPYVVKQLTTSVFSFVPEFDGFITEAVTGTNTGTMTGVYDSGHNGFKWTNAEVLTQDYDVVVRFRIPPNFTAMGGTLYMYNKVSSTFGSTGVRLVELLDTNGVNVITANTKKNATWTESTYAIGAGTWETGKLATLRFRLFADIGESAYLGEVRITYTTD